MIYAITLHQPWASFIAAGIKPFETRNWKPPAHLIGSRIAIHAAKKPLAVGDSEWGRRVGVNAFPLGAVVCTALLAGAYQCAQYAVHKIGVQYGFGISQTAAESNGLDLIRDDEFGDYHEGRWAWSLTDIERFDPAIPARGTQGFWKWDAPT